MNNCIKKCTSFALCVLQITIFAHGGKTPLGLHQMSKNNVFTPDQWKYVKVAGGVAGTAAVSYLADRWVGKGNGQLFYNGQYAWGYAQALKMSSLCLTIAPMMNEQWGDQFFRFGTRAPIVGGAAILIAHPTTQKLAAHAPFIGEQISTYTKTGDSKCSNCDGICNRCFIPKTLLVVGLYKAIDPLVDKIGTYVGKKCGFIQEDEKLE